MAQFEVGKKVICIRSHRDGVVKRGEIYELLAIKKYGCKICNTLVVDVGFKDDSVEIGKQAVCFHHGYAGGKLIADGIWWLSTCLFAPYDDSLSETTVDELLETISEPQTV